MSADDEKMKLFNIQFIVVENDGIKIKTIHSDIRGESMEQCYEYTRKLHNGEIKQ